MHVSVATQSRDELIHFFHHLGKALLEVDCGKPWMISAGSGYASNAGKSLGALAIDQIFNPGRYPNGIVVDLTPDTFLFLKQQGERKVVFVNFGWGIREDREEFDRELAYFKSRVPDAKVIFVSNIERTFGGVEFDYGQHGLASDQLDVRLHFQKTFEPFGRKVGITIENEELLSHVLPNVYPGASLNRRNSVRPLDFRNAPCVYGASL